VMIAAPANTHTQPHERAMRVNGSRRFAHSRPQALAKKW
jgi:hypothetical protein